MEMPKSKSLCPAIKGLIKIQKPNQLIWPTVNWWNAPACELAKLSTHKINQLTPLPYTFNFKNTTQLIQAFKDAAPLPSYKFGSLDIVNMYSNIPIMETRLQTTKLSYKTRDINLVWHNHPKKKIVTNKGNYQLSNKMD